MINEVTLRTKGNNGDIVEIEVQFGIPTDGKPKYTVSIGVGDCLEESIPHYVPIELVEEAIKNARKLYPINTHVEGY
jgi:hypothetical protein